MNNNVTKNTFFGKIPAGLSGLGLGVAGWSNAFFAQLNSKYFANVINASMDVKKNLEIASYSVQGICVFFTLICFILIAIKIIKSFHVFKKESHDPLISSYLPTEAMCLACIAFYIGSISLIGKIDPNNPYAPIVNAGTIIATILDLIAIIGHITLLSVFVVNVLIKHSIKNDLVYSSWLVPTCGLALSCGFEPKLGYLVPNEVYQATWYFGFAFLIVMVPYMFYKHVFFTAMSVDKTPSMAIFFAAPNLLLNGLLSIFPETSYYSNEYISALSFILLICSFMGMFFYFGSLLKSLRTCFHAGYAAFTFPISIAALATIKMGEFIYNDSFVNNEFVNLPFNNTIHFMIALIGFLFLVLGFFIITYIFIRYLILLKKLYIDYVQDCSTQPKPAI